MKPVLALPMLALAACAAPNAVERWESVRGQPLLGSWAVCIEDGADRGSEHLYPGPADEERHGLDQQRSVDEAFAALLSECEAHAVAARPPDPRLLELARRRFDALRAAAFWALMRDYEHNRAGARLRD